MGRFWASNPKESTEEKCRFKNQLKSFANIELNQRFSFIWDAPIVEIVEQEDNYV